MNAVRVYVRELVKPAVQTSSREVAALCASLSTLMELLDVMVTRYPTWGERTTTPCLFAAHTLTDGTLQLILLILFANFCWSHLRPSVYLGGLSSSPFILNCERYYNFRPTTILNDKQVTVH